jgi:GT2 family glycosyltransferase
MVIGGRVELWDKSHRPITIKTTLAEETLGRRTDPVGFIHGCNMNYHRVVYDRVGGFDVRFGPGAPLLCSDDLDFFYRAAEAGFSVVYSPKPVMFHNHGRTTDEQVGRLMRTYETSVGSFYAKHIARRHPMALRHFYWNVRASLRALVLRRRSDPPRRDTGLRLWHYLVGLIRYARAGRRSAG